MYVGNWGPLVFSVTGIRASSFSQISLKSSGRWEQHELINAAPLSQFLGPDLDEIELTMIFSRMLTMEPRAEFEAMRQFVRRGIHFPLLLQGIPQSMTTWYCEEITGESKVFAPRTGDILWLEITAIFKEYN